MPAERGRRQYHRTMDLTSKMLRDVEFRDRLRGYDTDEVDEFLERVAVGIDELHAELVAARHQLEAAPVSVPEPVPQRSMIDDDDAIRRTLILAQRTADLAISEAKAEADQLLEGARSESTRLVGDAQDAARRLASDAEVEVKARVARLTEQRETLEHDVRSLVALVDGERSRLAATLDILLSQVSGLTISESLEQVASPPPEPPTAPPAVPEEVSTSFLADDPSPDEESADLDMELDITAIAPKDERPVTAPVPTYSPAGEGTTSASTEDPEVDEALWERWASSGDSEKSGEDPFDFGHADG
jgi:DivIVA domain-containing protein